LSNNLPPEHPHHNPSVVPRDVGASGVSILGSGDGCAEVAGELGNAFVLALFVATHDLPPEITARYKSAFQSNVGFDTPQALISIAAICADLTEEARRLASSHTYWNMQAFRHVWQDPLFPPDMVMDNIKELLPSD
jgi:alkanesulfonate monooxygenase SsuD/methylene tetrahydromethanopterin reductase-like flavin-dependent oxidoreductase (luciferase family)